MGNEEKYVFAFLNALGGVPSFYRNIINGQTIIQPDQIKVILLNDEEDQRPKFTDSLKVSEVIIFNFSAKENQYYVQKRLGDLIGGEEGALITDNLLAIHAAHLCNNPKAIFHLIHDYFYVNQNLQVGDLVDIAIAHSSFFSDAVYASNPRGFNGRSLYIPYGVKQLETLPEKNNSILNLVFLGRLVEDKGVMRLFDIERGLVEKGILVNWTIIGKGPLKSNLLKQWADKKNIKFEEPEGPDDVYSILGRQDIFIFPTSFEGTPVSILECLANGVVTIANDLPGGIRDILKEGIGYTCRMNHVESFVKYIAAYNANREMLASHQRRCFQLGHEQYDIRKNADNYFKVFQKYHSLKREKRLKRVQLSGLDNSLFPNSFVKMLRKFRYQ